MVWSLISYTPTEYVSVVVLEPSNTPPKFMKLQLLEYFVVVVVVTVDSPINHPVSGASSAALVMNCAHGVDATSAGVAIVNITSATATARLTLVFILPSA